MRHSLYGVVDAVELSKATLRNMKQNLLGAFFTMRWAFPLPQGFYILHRYIAQPGRRRSGNGVVVHYGRQ